MVVGTPLLEKSNAFSCTRCSFAADNSLMDQSDPPLRVAQRQHQQQQPQSHPRDDRSIYSECIRIRAQLRWIIAIIALTGILVTLWYDSKHTRTKLDEPLAPEIMEMFGQVLTFISPAHSKEEFIENLSKMFDILQKKKPQHPKPRDKNPSNVNK